MSLAVNRAKRFLRRESRDFRRTWAFKHTLPQIRETLQKLGAKTRLIPYGVQILFADGVIMSWWPGTHRLEWQGKIKPLLTFQLPIHGNVSDGLKAYERATRSSETKVVTC